MTFSFHRFILLLKMQFTVNRRLYSLGVLAIAGILLVYMFFRAANGTFGFEFDAQEENYEFSLVFMSVVFGTMVFRQLDSKTRRIQSLMLPVSALERIGVASLIVLFVFPLTFTLIYFSCNALVNLADVHMLGHPNELYFFNGDSERQVMMIMYMLLPPVLLCAVSFRKLTFVRTLVLLCLSILVFSFFNNVLGRIVVNSANPAHPQNWKHTFANSTPFRSLTLLAKTPDGTFVSPGYYVLLPAGQQWIFTVFLCCIPLFFLYLTYLKLREQEL